MGAPRAPHSPRIRDPHTPQEKLNVNFDLTEEQQQVQQLARDFAKREIEPKAAELDKSGRWPGEIVAKMAELGILLERIALARAIPIEGGTGVLDEMGNPLDD